MRKVVSLGAYSYGRLGVFSEFYGERECASLGQLWLRLGCKGESLEGCPEGFVDVCPVDLFRIVRVLTAAHVLVWIKLMRRRRPGSSYLRSGAPGVWEPVDVKDPSLADDDPRRGAVHDEGDARDGARAEARGDGVDGIGDPCAEAGVAGLADGEVEGAGGEEGLFWVEAAVAEEGVDGYGEEGREC